MNNENNENKENINILNIPSKIDDNKNKTLIALDTNEDNYVSLKEFMSQLRSQGPREQPSGLFKNYAQATLSYHFINSLIKTKHPIISNIVCLPNLSYCIYSKPNTNYKEVETYVSVEQLCPQLPNLRGMYRSPLKSNLILFNPPEFTKEYKRIHKPNSYTFVIPDTLKDNLYFCNAKNKHMVFLNLFLVTTQNGRIVYQHANIIIINTMQKTIERFDPHGGSTLYEINESKNKQIKNLKRIYKQELIDEILKDKFKSVIPEYKYIALSETCPYLGPQTKVDAFHGLCITWSLMYFLLRVLNPEMKQSEINKRMISGKHSDILDRVLRFQKYVIDYLK
jgi:hypothetical protein